MLSSYHNPSTKPAELVGALTQHFLRDAAKAKFISFSIEGVENWEYFALDRLEKCYLVILAPPLKLQAILAGIIGLIAGTIRGQISNDDRDNQLIAVMAYRKLTATSSSGGNRSFPADGTDDAAEIQDQSHFRSMQRSSISHVRTMSSSGPSTTRPQEGMVFCFDIRVDEYAMEEHDRDRLSLLLNNSISAWYKAVHHLCDGLIRVQRRIQKDNGGRLLIISIQLPLESISIPLNLVLRTILPKIVEGGSSSSLEQSVRIEPLKEQGLHGNQQPPPIRSARSHIVSTVGSAGHPHRHVQFADEGDHLHNHDDDEQKQNHSDRRCRHELCDQRIIIESGLRYPSPCIVHNDDDDSSVANTSTTVNGRSFLLMRNFLFGLRRVSPSNSGAAAKEGGSHNERCEHHQQHQQQRQEHKWQEQVAEGMTMMTQLKDCGYATATTAAADSSIIVTRPQLQHEDDPTSDARSYFNLAPRKHNFFLTTAKALQQGIIGGKKSVAAAAGYGHRISPRVAPSPSLLVPSRGLSPAGGDKDNVWNASPSLPYRRGSLAIVPIGGDQGNNRGSVLAATTAPAAIAPVGRTMTSMRRRSFGDAVAAIGRSNRSRMSRQPAPAVVSATPVEEDQPAATAAGAAAAATTAGPDTGHDGPGPLLHRTNSNRRVSSIFSSMRGLLSASHSSFTSGRFLLRRNKEEDDGDDDDDDDNDDHNGDNNMKQLLASEHADASSPTRHPLQTLLEEIETLQQNITRKSAGVLVGRGAAGPNDDHIGRFLLADSDPVARSNMKELLVKQGQQFVEASDGIDCVRVYDECANKGEYFDVVLLADELTFMPGKDVAQTLRARGFKKRIIGLVGSKEPSSTATVSSDNHHHTSLAVVQGFFESGANAVLSKPVQLSDLQTVLSQEAAALTSLSAAPATVLVSSDVTSSIRALAASTKNALAPANAADAALATTTAVLPALPATVSASGAVIFPRRLRRSTTITTSSTTSSTSITTSSAIATTASSAMQLEGAVVALGDDAADKSSSTSCSPQPQYDIAANQYYSMRE